MGFFPISDSWEGGGCLHFCFSYLFYSILLLLFFKLILDNGLFIVFSYPKISDFGEKIHWLAEGLRNLWKIQRLAYGFWLFVTSTSGLSGKKAKWEENSVLKKINQKVSSVFLLRWCCSRCVYKNISCQYTSYNVIYIIKPRCFA